MDGFTHKEDGFTHKEIISMLFNAATSFTSILLTEGVQDDEAAARGAETAVELLDRVEHEVFKLIAAAEENEEPSSGEE